MELVVAPHVVTVPFASSEVADEVTALELPLWGKKQWGAMSGAFPVRMGLDLTRPVVTRTRERARDFRS